MVHYKRIACLSTSRADAGIYRPLLRALADDPQFDPILISSHDNTPADIPGLTVNPIPLNQRGDDPIAVAHAAGDAVGKFGESLAQIKPDLVFVLGDRTEMLAAALAATICTLPIAHLHAGDTTRGAYDDSCRHAITKLAHVHFAALVSHVKVLRALGEPLDRIQVVGALAIDELTRFRRESIDECSAAVGLDLKRPTLLVAFHPETISEVPVAMQVDCLARALSSTDMQILWIDPNTDVGHGVIHEAMVAAEKRGAVRLKSIPQDRFWSCLTHCRVMVGNSSAGIIEAPSFRRPVVNIGRRQEGRIRAANVIDVDFDSERISQAIKRAVSVEFGKTLKTLTNPYGDGLAADRILDVLEILPERMTLLRKPPPGKSTA